MIKQLNMCRSYMNNIVFGKVVHVWRKQYVNMQTVVIKADHFQGKQFKHQ